MKKFLTKEEVLEQANEVFPNVDWNLDSKDCGVRFVLDTRDIDWFNRIAVIVSEHPRRSVLASQKDQNKPRQDEAVSFYTLGSKTPTLGDHVGPKCVREALFELKQHLLEEIKGKEEELEGVRQLLAGSDPSKTASFLSKCERCDGEGRIELFSSVEDPCTKCGGSGMQQNGKIKLGQGCYNPSTRSRLKIKTEDT